MIFDGCAAAEGEVLPVRIVPSAGAERITIHHGSLDRTAKGVRAWFVWLGFDLEITYTREDRRR